MYGSVEFVMILLRAFLCVCSINTPVNSSLILNPTNPTNLISLKHPQALNPNDSRFYVSFGEMLVLIWDLKTACSSLSVICRLSKANGYVTRAPALPPKLSRQMIWKEQKASFATRLIPDAKFSLQVGSMYPHSLDLRFKVPKYMDCNLGQSILYEHMDPNSGIPGTQVAKGL